MSTEINTTECTTERLEGGRILMIWLDHPPANVLTPSMLVALDRARESMLSQGGADLAIIAGRGRMFSKGFDVNRIHAYPDRVAHRRSLWRENEIFNRFVECPKPIVAAIHGFCLGAGLELALSCHFRLCMAGARFGLPELTRGLLPGLGGVHRLVKLVGRCKALELTALGEMLSAGEAQQCGLVNRVLPKDDFLPGVLSFARALLATDQRLIQEAIRLTSLASRHDEQDALFPSVEMAIRLSTPVDVPPPAAPALPTSTQSQDSPSTVQHAPAQETTSGIPVPPTGSLLASDLTYSPDTY